MNTHINIDIHSNGNMDIKVKITMCRNIVINVDITINITMNRNVA